MVDARTRDYAIKIKKNYDIIIKDKNVFYNLKKNLSISNILTVPSRYQRGAVTRHKNHEIFNHLIEQRQFENCNYTAFSSYRIFCPIKWKGNKILCGVAVSSNSTFIL